MLDNRITIAAFLGLLWLPLCWSACEPSTRVSTTEQRELAVLPRLRLGEGDWAANLSALPARLDTYYDDHLGFRDDLIRAWAWLHIEIFGVSPSDSLVVGKDGWFFFGDADAIAQYRGIARFEADDLERWRTVLEERRDWLAERGIQYLVVLVPNKHRVYAEFMPDALPRMNPDSQLDQLVSHLRDHSDVSILDLRPALERARSKQRIYHKTDTHWNDIGATAGARAILDALTPGLPQLAGHPPLRFRRAERTTPGQGLARIVGLSRAYPENSLDLVVLKPRAGVPPGRRAAHAERVRRQQPFALGTGDPTLPRAVMFRDSFANALVPFLSESFDRILYVWERHLDRRVIEVEQPDVVIQQIAERFLGDLPVSLSVRETLPERR